MMTAKLHVRFTHHRIHCWPDAPERRAYLRHPHRHLFFVEVTTSADHDDRDIEFHDLQAQAIELFANDPETALADSCEMMARRLATALSKHHSRGFAVSVWEDNECGATVEVP